MRSEAGAGCPTCKTLASPEARFCKKCGTALAATRPDSHPAVPSEPPIRDTAAAGFASDAIEGERKTVTAMFADIKGSTKLIRDLDPEEARARDDRHYNAPPTRMRSAISMRRLICYRSYPTVPSAPSES
jgi:hypothetical protein